MCICHSTCPFRPGRSVCRSGSRPGSSVTAWTCLPWTQSLCGPSWSLSFWCSGWRLKLHKSSRVILTEEREMEESPTLLRCVWCCMKYKRPNADFFFGDDMAVYRGIAVGLCAMCEVAQSLFFKQTTTQTDRQAGRPSIGNSSFAFISIVIIVVMIATGAQLYEILGRQTSQIDTMLQLPYFENHRPRWHADPSNRYWTRKQ